MSNHDQIPFTAGQLTEAQTRVYLILKNADVSKPEMQTLWPYVVEAMEGAIADFPRVRVKTLTRITNDVFECALEHFGVKPHLLGVAYEYNNKIMLNDQMLYHGAWDEWFVTATGVVVRRGQRFTKYDANNPGGIEINVGKYRIFPKDEKPRFLPFKPFISEAYHCCWGHPDGIVTMSDGKMYLNGKLMYDGILPRKSEYNIDPSVWGFDIAVPKGSEKRYFRNGKLNYTSTHKSKYWKSHKDGVVNYCNHTGELSINGRMVSEGVPKGNYFIAGDRVLFVDHEKPHKIRCLYEKIGYVAGHNPVVWEFSPKDRPLLRVHPNGIMLIWENKIQLLEFK